MNRTLAAVATGIVAFGVLTTGAATASARPTAPHGVDDRATSNTVFTNCPDDGQLQPGAFDDSLTVDVSGQQPLMAPRRSHAIVTTPTGTVTFNVDSGPDQTGPLGAPTLVNGSASSDDIDFDEPGEYIVSATYSGDDNYKPSSDTCTVDVSTQASLTVSSSSDPGSPDPTSVLGEPVTFTVTLTIPHQQVEDARSRARSSAPAVPESCQPTVRAQPNEAECVELSVADYPAAPQTFYQSVEVVFDHTDQNTGADVYTGDSQEFDDLPVGDHYVEADYTQFQEFGVHRARPAVGFSTPPASLVQHVLPASQPNKRPSKTVLTSSANPSDPGAPVTFTAVVTPADGGGGTPSGSVTFAVDGVNHPEALAGGTATFVDDNLTAGAHPVTATYGGDSIFSPSADTLTQQVGSGAAALKGLLFTAPGTSALGLITVDGASTPIPIKKGSLPTSLAIGKDGRVWVAEAGKDAIAAVDATGNETDFPLASGAAPTSIAAGADGRLWFTEPDLHRIGAITTDGAVTTYRLGRRSDPTEITAGPNGRLWFTEPGRAKVGRIRANGHHKTFAVRDGSRPFGITTGPDGAIWFTEQAKRRIGRITTSGDVTDFKVDKRSRPSAIVTGPDGNLWFTEPGRSKIGRISPAGSSTSFNARAGSQPSSIVVGPDQRLWFTEPSVSRIGTMTRAGTFLDYGVASGSAPSDIISLS